VKWRTIAILVAAEVAILGLAVFSVRGAPSGEVFAADGTGTNFAAKTFAPIAAGNAPRVTIDDPNSGVTIGVSDDSLVYVKDDTSFSGATLRSPHDYPRWLSREISTACTSRVPRITKAGPCSSDSRTRVSTSKCWYRPPPPSWSTNATMLKSRI
jgi:hypothetical protein